MTAMKWIFLILAATILPLHAQDEAAQITQAKANEQRLRDSLRTVTQQFRTAEAERATALAGLAERDEKIAALEKQVTLLAKRSNEDKAAADKSIGKLQATVETQKQEITRLETALEKWKASHQKLTEIAQSLEAARARLDAQNIVSERKVADLERQNLELFKTAREILRRYADFSTGRAIAAREPFTGIAKARLEEQIQDYADKLEHDKLKPAPSDGQPSSNPAPSN